jgi:hypothetical protein
MVGWSSKHAFWQALVFTIIIFIFGLLLGYTLETSRSNQVEQNLFNSEINLLDEQVRTKVTEGNEIDCTLAKESLFHFADKIYGEAAKLEEYDSASKFTDSFKILHRRYDLLRTMLWIESNTIQKNCPGKFHTLVYLYNYNVDNINVNSLENAYSSILRDLKSKYPNDILLIPIAANLDLDSINLASKAHNITSYPVIIVDNKQVISELPTLAQMEKIVFQSNKQ